MCLCDDDMRFSQKGSMWKMINVDHFSSFFAKREDDQDDWEEIYIFEFIQLCTSALRRSKST